MLVCDENPNDFEYTTKELDEVWEKCQDLYGIK